MQKTNHLKLSFTHDGDPNDSFGRLNVEVAADGFAGLGGMWVQWQDLLELSEKLAAFPLPEQNPPTEDWGYGEVDDYRSIVKLRFANAGKRGPVSVLVQISDDDESDLFVSCKFKVGYAALDRFRVQLNEMAKDKSGSCLLSDLDSESNSG
ncbi:MAG: hypothetical protein ACI9TB_001321 [Parasphingorhabdus sp.]|jgi:hypothetical protein|uniref:hypothetical protein n=1 Tax=Parasphingorhabdus sp. TaxID=2709688 RepID=UPI002B26F972|nr:hypothetical protein [Parasphingorhabdus sp.]|tara:strand:- start:1610 stop:2062 length:453 start_codon:yes stop_codon:yes gene_type:complete